MLLQPPILFSITIYKPQSGFSPNSIEFMSANDLLFE